MRRKDTSTEMFRRLLREIAQLLAYEVTRDLPLEMVPIETPLAAMTAPQISGKKLCLVSILRAGNGMLDGMLEILPAARVGHIGLYRDPATLVAVEYYFKVPEDIADRLVIVVDPMLATGHSAVGGAEPAQGGRRRDRSSTSACWRRRRASPRCRRRIRTSRSTPRPSTTTSTTHGYIVPGLGDAGDRLFGTK